MKIRRGRFNIIFLLSAGIAVLGLTGCESMGGNKNLGALRLHLETNLDGTERTKSVPVYREKPFLVTIDNSPFITESHVSEAKVIDSMGGFAIELHFERRGTWLLESVTAANRGRRCVVYAEFKDPQDEKKIVTRWLAAPMLTQKISDGVFTFTPDASREEAEQLVVGLNKLAKKLEKNWTF